MAGNNLGFISAGLEAELSMAIGGLIPQIPGQTFRNKPVVNRKPALYQLVIREPQPSNNVYGDFIFPLSPEGIRTRYGALSNVYDVAGTPKEQGVHRIVDQFGNSPPTFTLVGTTGWQKHSTDGYKFTGLESYQELRALFYLYAGLNAQQVEKNLPDMYRMEFYDFFSDEYWEVVPVGEQEFSMRRDRPLLHSFRISLAATKELDKPEMPKIDPIQTALGKALSEAANEIGEFFDDMFSNYSTVTLQSE